MGPIIDYDTSSTLSLTLEARPWEVSTRTIGADDIAASGIPEAFVVRTDRMRRLTLRFLESEWPSVEAWLDWARGSGQSFAFTFDPTDEYSEALVYLEAPRISEDVAPRRNGEYRWMLELDVTLRTTDGTPFPGTWVSQED